MLREKVSKICLLAATILCTALLLSSCQSAAPDTSSLTESAEGLVPGLEGVDLAAAAEKLGISTEDLTGALGSPPDVAAAAEKLGISQSSLMEALGV